MDASAPEEGPDRPLSGRLAVVAGASRGVGRGLALALGEAGATVVCVARSTRFGARTEARPETVEDAAESIVEAGGRGYPYVCDCTDRSALEGLALHVRKRFGVPDVVACAVWGGNEGFDGARHADGEAWGAPFWRRDPAALETALATGAHAFVALTRAFAPAMAARRRGLVVAVGFDALGFDGPDAVAREADALADGRPFVGDAVYDLGKRALLAACRALAPDLAQAGVSLVHLTPGFVRTERVLEAGHGDLATESPVYAGRALVALAQETLAPGAAPAPNGRSVFVAELARRHGFTDTDGTAPPRFTRRATPAAGIESDA